MPFVPDLILHQFCDQLHARDGSDGIDQVIQLFFGYGIPLQEPEEIEVSEFGQEIFAIELVVIEKMLERGAGFAVFVYAEEIFYLLACQLDLDFVVYAEIEAKAVIQLPAELVVLYRRDDAEEAGALEKFPRYIIDMEL
jgi:hypothetical protein